jgi:hypothetical protein
MSDRQYILLGKECRIFSKPHWNCTSPVNLLQKCYKIPLGISLSNDKHLINWISLEVTCLRVWLIIKLTASYMSLSYNLRFT